jgi:hypothetical protein
MTPQRHEPQRSPGIAGEVARLVGSLSKLRDALNAAKEEDELEVVTLVEEAIAAAVPAPFIAADIGQRYDALAAPYPFRYTISGLVRSTNPKKPDVVMPLVRTKSPMGLVVAWLHDYFGNPQRDRLRRCTQCRTWFLDTTRNGSALRCSRVCTRKWWSAPERHHSATNGRPGSTGGGQLPTRRVATAAAPVRRRA